MFGIELSVLAAFIATSVAIIISPGPDTLIILRHAINGGRGPGLAAGGEAGGELAELSKALKETH